MFVNKKLFEELKNLPKKNLFEELERVVREGYDDTKFCDPQCVLTNGCCDHCVHYAFNGIKVGKHICYNDCGMCKIHGRREPEDGDDCADFICTNVQKDQEAKEGLDTQSSKP